MTYPNLLRRYLASVIDILAVIFIVFVLSTTPIYSSGGDSGLLLLVGVVASYEPLMTAYRCTLGQAIMRFRVRRNDGRHRISIGQAYLRLVVKYFLGLISFLTMPARRDRRAIHDLAAGTIVVEASSAKQNSGETASGERHAD
jgi:uncharacterized RDD family membrane protein YckC